MEKNVQWYVHQCPNCQVAQGLKKSLEWREAQHLVDIQVKPFKQWGIDLISCLPITPNDNWWIITTIDYTTDWPLTRAIQDVTEKEIGQFMQEEIFINYGAPREIISDNGTNLVEEAI